MNSIPPEWYQKNPDLNACPGDLIDTPLMKLKLAAAERTLTVKMKEFDAMIAIQRTTHIEDASDSDCESVDSRGPMGAMPWPSPKWEDFTKEELTSFIRALPHFLLLNLCCCPCSKLGQEWGKLFRVKNNQICEKNKPFKPNALIAHLNSGGHSGGNLLPKIVSHYLEELYRDFYAGERRQFDHEALHQPGKARDQIVEFKRLKMER
jgi:hypothetical protein